MLNRMAAPGTGTTPAVWFAVAVLSHPALVANEPQGRHSAPVSANAADTPAVLDRLVPDLMSTHHVPGVSVVGIADRRLAWDRQYGVLRAGGTEKVERDTVFEACSMSKPPLAYLALKLVEGDKLDLGRPLCQYLDKPYLDNESRHERITARMVLSHTTGFPNWRPGGWRSGKPLHVTFEPGTRFGYSGEGFLYLQRVVEQITGTPWSKYVDLELFKPLGLTISSYQWQERFDDLAAAGHDAQGQVKMGRRLFTRANAGYSLYCTPTEYAQLIVEILKKDRSAAHSLSNRSLDLMFTRTTKATGRKPIRRSEPAADDAVWWGLGWAIDRTASGDRIYHSGANGTGFRCYCEFDRQRGTGIVIMTNAISGRALWEEVIARAAPP